MLNRVWDNSKRIVCHKLHKHPGSFPREITSVGIVMSHHAEMIAAILAVLKCGARYVPAEPECTQKDLVDMLLQSKQSIHSALKSLVKDGYVGLEYSEDNHRSKHIHLTEKGAALAKDTADKIVYAENIAFSSLTDSERKTILDLFECLTSALDKEMQKVKKNEI